MSPLAAGLLPFDLAFNGQGDLFVSTGTAVRRITPGADGRIDGSIDEHPLQVTDVGPVLLRPAPTPQEFRVNTVFDRQIRAFGAAGLLYVVVKVGAALGA